MKKNFFHIIIALLTMFLSSCNQTPTEEIVSETIEMQEGSIDLKSVYDERVGYCQVLANKGTTESTRYYYSYHDYESASKRFNVNIKYKSVVSFALKDEFSAYIVEFYNFDDAEKTAEKMNNINGTGVVKSYKNLCFSNTINSLRLLFDKQTTYDEVTCLNVGEEVVAIDTSKSFDDNKKRPVILLEEGVTQIDGMAFLGLSNLVSFGSSFTLNYIGYAAFYYCVGLKDITLLDGLKEIGGLAFNNCTSLTFVRIPPTVEIIWSQAFYNCTSLQTVVIPNGVKKIQNEVFNYGNVFCEAKEKPSTWKKNFATGSATVYWGDEWEYDERNIPVPLVEK